MLVRARILANTLLLGREIRTLNILSSPQHVFYSGIVLEKLQILYYLYISDRNLKIYDIEKKKLRYIYHTMLEPNCNFVIIV